MTSTRSQPPHQEPTPTNRVLTTTLFTVVELWAVVVVLKEVHASDTAAVGLSVTLAATVIAVVDAWRGVPGKRGEGQ